MDIFPLYQLESTRLFANGNTAGFHLFRDRRWKFDLLARYRFDQFLPDNNQPGDENLRDREQTVDAGLSVEFRPDWGELRAVWVTDTQSKHHGHELELTYRRRFENRGWQLTPFATVSWQDSDLTDYYYGIDTDEVAPGTPVYQTDSALNAEVGLKMTYMLTDRVFLLGNLSMRFFDETITDSPIVEDSVDANAFVGAGYLFDGPHKSRDALSAGQGLWSYRINYAITAEENIAPWLMAGWWEPSTEADTSLMGLTVGRLLSPGEVADIYLRGHLYRHFERDLQDDTWSIAGSVMAIGRGYLPWSDKLAFRWGFGWGLSYADEILAVEQIKQENRGDKTNHLLAFLEWQVDFPIDRLIKSRLTNNCFFGASVVHRSGIFGSSSFLGDVSGGSDFIGLHVECLR